MTTSQNSVRTGAGNPLAVFLLVLNLIVMLLPPIHLSMAKGDMAWAMAYFVGGPIVLIVSLFILFSIDPSDEVEVGL